MSKRNINLLQPDWWSDLYQVKSNSTWWIPQAQAAVSKIPLVTGDDGLVSPKQTLVSLGKLTNSGTLQLTKWGHDWDLGSDQFLALWKTLTLAPRGDIVYGSQVKDSVSYNSGVPLILDAFRKYRNLPYSRWDWSDPHILKFLDPHIGEFVPYILGQEVLPAFSRDELVEVRNTAAVVKTGKTAGEVRSLTSAIPLPRTGPWNEVPRLIKYLITQTWCWHPTLRHPGMICDLGDLDNLPQALVSDEVVEVAPKVEKKIVLGLFEGLE